MQRRVDTLRPRERFLIVCEGEKTEPNYFRGFRVPKEIVEIVGLGANTVGIVKEAIRRDAEEGYDQVWCVFDRDSFPANNFNDALNLARKSSIRVAYSNQCFELWYLLHFNYYHTAISRKDYINKLTKVLGYKYEKNSETAYDDLITRQSEAILNARRLLREYSPAKPLTDDPSTTVHLLVQQLNRFLT